MTYCFDLDGTLCSSSPEDYTKAIPWQARIDSVNKLYTESHHIVIYTARGMGTGIDYRTLTEWQLSDWGVLYHDLIMGKPLADVYIDNKGISDEEFFNE